MVCAGSLDLLLGLTWILPGPLQPSLFRGLSCLRLICMSIPPSNHDAGVKLHITLPGDLQVSVSGPSSSSARAAELLGYISLFEPGAGTTGSDRSFELVSSPPNLLALLPLFLSVKLVTPSCGLLPLSWQVVFSLCSALWVVVGRKREDRAGLVGWAVGWCCALQ